MSIVLPPPAQPARHYEYQLSSRSSTPTQRVSRPGSRPGTPPASALPHLSSPISAPSTPVVQTHHLGDGFSMERCHSSEARLGQPERGGRTRDPKATSLLFPALAKENKVEWVHVEGDAIVPVSAEEEKVDDKMDIDPPEVVAVPAEDEIHPAPPVEIDLHLPAVEEDKPKVWGMPRWGREDERKEVRKGVRLVGMEELPGLIEQHSLLDTPSQILFPWLHGISDDGVKGREMAAFFGRDPPFEPPSYRGLSLLLSPPQFDMMSESSDTSSESHTSASTDATSLSLADSQTSVQMHPCESKRPSPSVNADATQPERATAAATDSSSESEDDKPSCILLNSLHVQDVFEINDAKPPQFRNVKLPYMINLRNLNIQQIKYSTISDIILYSKGGVGNGVLRVAEKIAQAQEALWQFRMEDYYKHLELKEGGEGVQEPVRYGVWVVVEPFHKLEKHCPHLVNIDSRGEPTGNSPMTDLFDREAKESRAMTRGSEVVEGFWVGNDCDVPGGADDGAGAKVAFDLCVKASELCDMPSTMTINTAYNKLQKLERKSDDSTPSWVASPATTALRNLLSPSASASNLPNPLESPRAKRAGSPEDPNTSTPRRKKPLERYVTLECAGSARMITGAMRNPLVMMERVVELVYFLRRIIEDKDKTGVKRKVLVHCQDGYTESSILVLSYIMSSLSCSLAEAYLHLQLVAKRSFFLYPSDKPILLKIEKRFAHDRRQKASKLIASSPAASPRWKWSFSKAETNMTVETAKEMIAAEDAGGSQAAQDAQVWFNDRRFDGFPSRILPFLYLGNLDHASNSKMLKAIGVTHVVSVGESLLDTELAANDNHLSHAYKAGDIDVLDLWDVRDDGNDPLRPLISRACLWIEEARQKNGCVLVHCRVGVSRSASIVMAYMMQYQNMGLMDAYLITRARRLNVLIQPNLRFFHELFGWEVELAKQQEELSPSIKRDIMYSWPAFCRDLYCLNRRFLCN